MIGTRIRVALAVAGTVALVFGGLVLADRWFPPDLHRLTKPSRSVIDASGRLLTAMPAEEGRWRLPVAVEAVDPLYLSLLIAYEDRRFERHPGVDPLALLRAVGDAAMAGRLVSGASTLTGAKRRSSAASFSMCLRYSSRVVAPIV